MFVKIKNGTIADPESCVDAFRGCERHLYNLDFIKSQMLIRSHLAELSSINYSVYLSLFQADNSSWVEECGEKVVTNPIKFATHLSEQRNEFKYHTKH